MKRFIEPARETWTGLTGRPALDTRALFERVEAILNDVQKEGDAAVQRYTAQFDGVNPSGSLLVTDEEMQEVEAALPAALKSAIELAARNIETFHAAQVEAPRVIETMPGVRCWRKPLPIAEVGLYVPGGTAPLFSTVLMLGIPAAVAGCARRVLCTPPQKDGRIHPAILYAARVAGIRTIYKAGGVQAIGAMAFGTSSLPPVSKIFGPGNQYVTAAKQLVQQKGVAIDMPAGPSEVCVIADASAPPRFVAADLLSQAEHGADSQVMLVCSDVALLEKIEQELNLQLAALPRNAFAAAALEHSAAVVLANETDRIAFANAYAPEHLILSCERAEALANQVQNAGSVFIGHYSPESVGDYASGTNHTLPTAGYARAYSGVSVDSFVKKITFQQLSREGLQALAPAVMNMAMAEGLQAHANAVAVRLEKDSSK